MKEKLLSGGMIAGMIVAWSCYYAASKVLVGAADSAFLAGFLLRASALVFLTVQLCAVGKVKEVLRPGRVVWVLLCIGVLGFLLDTFANLGYVRGDLGTGTALLKTDVLMANLATVVLYKKKLYFSDWVGTLVMLAGVLLVLGVRFDALALNWYDLLFIASALCVTANAFVIKAAQDKLHVDTDVIAYYNNLVVLVLFFLSSLATGALPKLSAISAKGLWWVAIVGGLAQTLIYFFYYRNLKTHEVWMVKLYLLLMPVLSCFIGVSLLGEEMSAGKAAGIAVVLAGAAVILLRERLNKTEVRNAA